MIIGTIMAVFMLVVARHYIVMINPLCVKSRLCNMNEFTEFFL